MTVLTLLPGNPAGDDGVHAHHHRICRLLRQALGMATTPSNQISAGLALS